MGESEMFDEFYAHFTNIVNSSFNLGERIPKSQVVKKILRSLPERFNPKVTVLNSLRNIDNMKSEELFVDLQTYELDMFPQNPKKKDKSIALKAPKEDTFESDDSHLDPNGMALFTKKNLKIHKFKRQNSKFDKQKFEKNKNLRKTNKIR